MEVPEVEIMPGVYVTDYRKKEDLGGRGNRNQGGIKQDIEEFRRELVEKGLNEPSYLGAERHRLERSIEMMRDTNKQLSEISEAEYLEIINENSEVIGKYQNYIKVLDELLGESGSIYL